MKMSFHANGRFEVKLQPLEAPPGHDGMTLGRISIDKQFHGQLEGSSQGQMLSALSPVKGSGGYVAIEQVSGTLNGRQGSFVLQHSGSMAAGGQQLTITVVPDSGSGELAGLSGTLAIRIENGQHYYDFDYQLP